MKVLSEILNGFLALVAIVVYVGGIIQTGCFIAEEVRDLSNGRGSVMLLAAAILLMLGLLSILIPTDERH